jgi:hypothetical protein
MKKKKGREFVGDGNGLMNAWENPSCYILSLWKWWLYWNTIKILHIKRLLIYQFNLNHNSRDADKRNLQKGRLILILFISVEVKLFKSWMNCLWKGSKKCAIDRHLEAYIGFLPKKVSRENRSFRSLWYWMTEITCGGEKVPSFYHNRYCFLLKLLK